MNPSCVGRLHSVGVHDERLVTVHRFRLGHLLKTSLWFVPFLFVLGGTALSLLATAVDDGTLLPQSLTGDPTAALQILYLVSFSMLTLTGLVLSLVVVVVQLAMGVFSPRIVRQILQDRPSQCAIGLFAGTFAFAVLAMREVRTAQSGGSVPGLALVIGVLLVLVCIATLLWYLDHIGQSLRVAALVGWVADDTMTALDHVYPAGAVPADEPDQVVTRKSGVLFKVEHDRLVALAERSDCCLELQWAVGDYVPLGATVVRVVGDPGGLAHREVLKCLALGPERTMNQDVAYGIRMLVDIAERSLASGPFDDPTTAVQAIDRLHDILRQLVRRPLHSGLYHDQNGAVRLSVPTMRWDGYVRVAFEEITQAGAGSPQVARRLKSALADLLSVAAPERRAPLERQLAMLEALFAAASTSEDRAVGLVADPSGIGSAVDLITAPHR